MPKCSWFGQFAICGLVLEPLDEGSYCRAGTPLGRGHLLQVGGQTEILHLFNEFWLLFFFFLFLDFLLGLFLFLILHKREEVDCFLSVLCSIILLLSSRKSITFSITLLLLIVKDIIRILAILQSLGAARAGRGMHAFSIVVGLMSIGAGAWPSTGFRSHSAICGCRGMIDAICHGICCFQGVALVCLTYCLHSNSRCETSYKACRDSVHAHLPRQTYLRPEWHSENHKQANI